MGADFGGAREPLPRGKNAVTPTPGDEMTGDMGEEGEMLEEKKETCQSRSGV